MLVAISIEPLLICLRGIQGWAGFPSPEGGTTVLGGVKSRPVSGWLRFSVTPAVRRGLFYLWAMENSASGMGSQKQLGRETKRRASSKRPPGLTLPTH